MDDELLQDFLVESGELLDQLDQDFVELESNPTSPQLLAGIFRAVHTIKGTAGFLAFDSLEGVTHAGESLLSLLRDGALTLNAEMTDTLLAVVDATRSMLKTIAETGNDEGHDWSDLVTQLHRLAESGGGSEADEPQAESNADTEQAEPEPASVTADAATDATAEEVTAPTPPEPTVEAAPTPAANEPAGESEVVTKPAESTIRVDVDLLDRLMNLTGELVLARNQVLQFHASTGDPIFHNTAQQLDLITTEMQESVMQTRMQPIGNIWSKFPRIVRDLAAGLDKQVDLEMIGKETELDKTLVEAIKDPLTHIVRNSVDHGIETPEDRIAAGKPPRGRLELRAFHEGGQVIIEITDDGKGLDADRIRASAVAKGLISAEKAERLSDKDAATLVFTPGFSTAEKVTNVSGRGVGMDVVRTNVEKIGGSVDISTDKGIGTTLTVKIPLTLAIIPALIVTCADDYYMIPQINLVEVLHIEPGDTPGIESVGDAEVFRLRGSLLPVVHLRSVLNLDHEGSNHDEEGTSIVVLNADGHLFGLVVDRINDTEEIVVKPLAPNLKHLLPFGGTTIMGDGTVALILDAIGIAQSADIFTGSDVDSSHEKADDGERRAGPTTVLVSRIGESRIAIPVALVARLEELDRSTVERAGGRELVQYRGRLLTLFRVGDAIGYEHDEVIDPTQPLSVLVHERGDNLYGFIIDEILDVYDVDLETGVATDGSNILASSVIGNRATNTIDLQALIRAIDQRFLLEGAERLAS